MYEHITEAVTLRVRAAILAGETIASIMKQMGLPKRFVEDQRKILRDRAEIPDARHKPDGIGARIRRMHKDGASAADIAKALGTTTNNVYKQRSK